MGETMLVRFVFVLVLAEFYFFCFHFKTQKISFKRFCYLTRMTWPRPCLLRPWFLLFTVMIVNGTAPFTASSDGSACSELDKVNFTERRWGFVDQKFVVLVILIIFLEKEQKTWKRKKKKSKSQKSEFFSIIWSANNLFKKSRKARWCEPLRTPLLWETELKLST